MGQEKSFGGGGQFSPVNLKKGNVSLSRSPCAFEENVLHHVPVFSFKCTPLPMSIEGRVNKGRGLIMKP